MSLLYIDKNMQNVIGRAAVLDLNQIRAVKFSCKKSI